MSKEQHGHVYYTFYYKQRGLDGIQHSEKIKGRLLWDALYKFCKQCMEEDDTGIFFEMENADADALRKNKKFHEIKVGSEYYGIELEDVKIESPYRNKYVCEMRAKRELLNLTAENFANICGLPYDSYRQKEAGTRGMKLNEYARYMKLLETYENDN